MADRLTNFKYIYIILMSVWIILFGVSAFSYGWIVIWGVGSGLFHYGSVAGHVRCSAAFMTISFLLAIFSFSWAIFITFSKTSNRTFGWPLLGGPGIITFLLFLTLCIYSAHAGYVSDMFAHTTRFDILGFSYWLAFIIFLGMAGTAVLGFLIARSIAGGGGINAAGSSKATKTSSADPNSMKPPPVVVASDANLAPIPDATPASTSASGSDATPATTPVTGSNPAPAPGSTAAASAPVNPV